MTTLFALFAEVERDLISERTREGLAKARAAGRKLGRPKGSLGVSRLDGKQDQIRHGVLLAGRPHHTTRCRKKNSLLEPRRGVFSIEVDLKYLGFMPWEPPITGPASLPERGRGSLVFSPEIAP